MSENVQVAQGQSDDKVSFLQTACYGIGSFGANIIYFFMATYLMFFYTDSVGLAAGALSVMFLVTKVIDAGTDILWGIIVDNTYTKWGKFKPFIVAGTALSAVATVALFMSPDVDTAGKMVYAYATYILWNLTFSIVDTSYWSLSSAVTQDQNERNKVIAVPRTIATFGNLAISAFTLPLVGMLGSWTTVAIVISVTYIICMTLTVLFVPEKYTTKRKTPQTPLTLLKMLKANGPYTRLLGSMFLMEMVTTVRAAFQLYFFKYNLGMENVVATYLTSTLLCQTLGSAVSPFVSKRFGKKRTALACLVLVAVCCALMFTVQHLYWGVMVFGSLASFFTGIATICQFSMMTDCIEYNEYKTGERSEGAVYSLNILKSQISNAIGTSMGAAALELVGYVANQAQSDSTLFWIGGMFTFVPAILSVICLLPLVKYELTEKRYGEILSVLRERRAAKA